MDQNELFIFTIRSNKHIRTHLQTKIKYTQKYKHTLKKYTHTYTKYTYLQHSYCWHRVKLMYLQCIFKMGVPTILNYISNKHIQRHTHIHMHILKHTHTVPQTHARTHNHSYTPTHSHVCTSISNHSLHMHVQVHAINHTHPLKLSSNIDVQHVSKRNPKHNNTNGWDGDGG